MNIQKSFSRLIIFTAIIYINCISNVQAQQTVIIGTQIWMTRNLGIGKFRNGEIIPQAKTNEEWTKAAINKQPAWCFYNNDPVNGGKYGKLYNGYAVNDSRGLAPAGWHIPSDSEWVILSTTLGGEAIAGGKLKEAGTSNWTSPNTGGSNNSGFAGLPGGLRFGNGEFGFIGSNGDWSSSSEDLVSDIFRWGRELCFNYGNVNRKSINNSDGVSVRCLKD